MKHILVDMDGVLCDFFGAALSLWGFDSANYPAQEWEIANVLGISVSDFWGTIDKVPDFWRNIQPYPWTADLIEFLDGTGARWKVLTHAWRDPQCAAQKVEWLQKNICRDFDRFSLDGSCDKYLLAGPGRLLIDDSDKNVSSFIAHGGSAVLFPQRWNSLHHVSDGYAFVKASLKHFIGV